MAAVEAGDRDGWLALFADDAVVEDPIGPSFFDPQGTGHHGKEAIAHFYDTAIAPNQRIEFAIRESYQCANEVANVGTIRITLSTGQVSTVDGVYCYRVGPDGLLESLRAFWEQDRIVFSEPE
jgi:ketosteroid isomerase-like protein